MLSLVSKIGLNRAAMTAARKSGPGIQVHPVIQLQSRGVMEIFNWDENDPAEREDIAEFADWVENCGCDPYPHFKKEALKPKEVRYDVKNKVKGKLANRRVRGLVQFIELKRSHKYQ